MSKKDKLVKTVKFEIHYYGRVVRTYLQDLGRALIGRSTKQAEEIGAILDDSIKSVVRLLEENTSLKKKIRDLENPTVKKAALKKIASEGKKKRSPKKG